MPTSIGEPSHATPPRDQTADERRVRHGKILAGALILAVLTAGIALAVTRSSPSSVAGVTPATATSVTPGVSGAGTISITIDNFAFSPSSVNLKAGTSVVWTNHDADVHTVRTTATATLTSDPLDTNATFSYRFNTAGVYAYHCSIHPEMHGTVVVTK